MKMKIVIPIYKRWDLCNELLRGLYKYEVSRIDEVVLVDDDSRDANVSEGISLYSKVLPITQIVNKTNQGFTKSSNIGLIYACQSDSIVFLISTDVSVTGGFIERVQKHLSNGKIFLGQRLIFHDTGWNTFGNKTFQYLEGFFLAARSDAWKEFGYFDEQYSPFDYEDIDISTKARSLGYSLSALNSPHIKHIGGQTIGYSREREEITNRNKKYFMEKWL